MVAMVETDQIVIHMCKKYMWRACTAVLDNLKGEW